MKKFLYVCLLVIIVGSVIASVALSLDWESGLLLSATIMSGLCGVATFFIAILLYDRYGIDSATRQKSMEAISSLINEMQRVNFILGYYPETHDGEAPSDFILGLSFRSKKEDVIKYISSSDCLSILCYKYSGMYGCTQLVEKASNLVFLPSPIYSAVKKLTVFEYSESKQTKDSRPVTVLSSFSDVFKADKDSLDADETFIPKTNYKVCDFVDYYFAIKGEIVKWYKENGVDIQKLNIEVQ